MKQKIKHFIICLTSIIPKNKHKIIFESHSDLSDSSKVLYDYLMKKYPKKYKYVWMVENRERFKDDYTTTYVDVNKGFSVKYIYHVLTSKYIFFTHRAIRWANLKKQIVVNLTHGMPLKASKGKLPNDNDFNYLLSTNTTISDIQADQHLANPKKSFICGMPRNDLLFRKNKDISALVKDYNKIIIWLPTFRKHKSVNMIDSKKYKDRAIPLFNDEELNELNEKLKQENNLLILKFHPAQDLKNFKNKLFSNIKMMTNEDLDKMNIHLYSLLAYSDILLTDYSSVSVDYLLTNKPIGYIIDDLSDYQDNREFCFENFLDYCPGEKIHNSKEFYSFLEDINKGIDKYVKERKKVKDFYHLYQSDNGCETITKYFNL